VVYEWQDAKYLGIDRDGKGVADNEWEDEVRTGSTSGIGLADQFDLLILLI
jgi:hypothetical protein